MSDTDQAETEYKVRINYKSGHQHVGWFTVFQVTRADDGSLAGVTYTTADGANFLFLGLEGIESITQLSHRKKAVKK